MDHVVSSPPHTAVRSREVRLTTGPRRKGHRDVEGEATRLQQAAASPFRAAGSHLWHSRKAVWSGVRLGSESAFSDTRHLDPAKTAPVSLSTFSPQTPCRASTKSTTSAWMQFASFRMMISLAEYPLASRHDALGHCPNLVLNTRLQAPCAIPPRITSQPLNHLGWDHHVGLGF